MPMAGDKKNLMIASTRTILINAPKSEVWKWLIQLGADRGGFYSYTFIEKALGYKTRYQDMNKPEFNDIKVGDIIRGSVNEENSIIPYNFKVLYVKPEDTFVLENWGTFLLEKVNDQQTRLVIRTQEVKAPNLLLKAANFIILPLHYIMERRMLLGIKMHVEKKSGIFFSQGKDLLWFFGIVISWFLIYFLVFIGRGFFQSVFVPVFFSVFWVLVVLLLNPTPFYSSVLLLSLCLIVLNIVLMRIKKRNDAS
jgi:hypothetical protein